MPQSFRKIPVSQRLDRGRGGKNEESNAYVMLTRATSSTDWIPLPFQNKLSLENFANQCKLRNFNFFSSLFFRPVRVPASAGVVLWRRNGQAAVGGAARVHGRDEGGQAAPQEGGRAELQGE